MVKKCVYCSKELDEDSVVDVCVACGHGVWGEKMFGAIRENMENARNSGNLHQGSISDDMETGASKAF
jgi:hypothetical protein